MKKLLLAFISMLMPFLMAAQCTTNNSTSCNCKDGTTNCDLLPDIIVGRPTLLVNGTSGYIEYPQVCPGGCSGNDGRLRISVSSPNIGFGPLEVRAINTIICGTDTFVNPASGFVCPNGDPLKQLVNQRIYHKNGNTMTYYDRPAGSMTYHPSHGHMHVDDWGIYTLRTATTNPDPLTWPIVGTGSKLAFCLMDYGSCSTYNGHCVDSVNNILTNSNFPNFGLGGGAYGCSPTIQGISSGYTDIYYQSLDGMWINLPPGLCNGQYWVVVQLDPKGYFLESNENNNVIAVPITLTQQNGVVPTVTASGATTFCQGGSVILTSSASANYLWSNGATTQAITVSQSGSYSVTVNSTSSCPTTSSPKVVTVNPLTVSATATPAGICPGETVQLNAVATSNGTVTQTASFSNNTIYAIPDNNPTGVTSAVTVSGLNPTTLLSNSVVSVTINITHTYDADLIISLISPSGNTINLSNSRGGNADNFVNTVFSASATTSISAGTAPFTGSYLPEAAFSSLTGNLNGTWSLKVVDHAGTDQGTINNWTLQLNQSLPTTLSYAWTSNPVGYTSSLASGTVNPLTTTNYIVTVTESSTGCTGTQTIPVTVGNSLHVTTNSPNAICAGGSTTLTASGAPSYTWSPAIGLSATSSSTVTANPSQTTTYKVVGTNGGCKDSATVTVVVNPLPPVAVNTPAAICAGSSTTLNATGASTYNWAPSFGLNIYTGPTVVATANQTTTYIVTGTDANGCTASALTVVGVNQIPVVNLNSNALIVCSGQPTTLTASGASSYSWSPSLGLDVSTGSTVISTVTSPITYTVTGTSNNCSSTASVTISINNIPATPSAINTTATTFCAPFNASYNITSVTNTNGYTWTVPAGLTIVSGQGTESITVSGTVAVSGNICVTADNVCGSSLPSCIAINITSGVPGAIGTILPTTGKACPNDIVTYSISPIANTTSYKWIGPIGSTILSGQGSTSVVVQYNPSFTGGTYLQVRGSNACGLGPNKSKLISLNIPSTPGAITGSNSGVCLSTLNYSVTLVNGMTYVWKVPANASILSGQGTNAISVQYAAGFVSGNITVFAQNGCGNSGVRTKSISAAPVKVTSITGPLSVCTAQSGVTYSIAAVPSAISYVWAVPGGTITSGQGSTSIQVTFAANPRNAYVQVTPINSCAAAPIKTITVVVNACAKVYDFNSNGAALNLQPNPANNYVEVLYNTDLTTPGKITLNNILGQVQYSQIINPEEGKNSYMIDLRKFPSGIYMLNVHQGDRNYTQRLVIE